MPEQAIPIRPQDARVSTLIVDIIEKGQILNRTELGLEPGNARNPEPWVRLRIDCQPPNAYFTVGWHAWLEGQGTCLASADTKALHYSLADALESLIETIDKRLE